MRKYSIFSFQQWGIGDPFCENAMLSHLEEQERQIQEEKIYAEIEKRTSQILAREIESRKLMMIKDKSVASSDPCSSDMPPITES